MARKSVVVAGASGIDTSDFKAAAKALRNADKVLNREIRNELRKAGLVVAASAKVIAGKHSRTIPPSIRIRTSAAGVAVVAGGDQAPVALPFELGNVGSRRSSSAGEGGVFRHPVFGDKNVWAQQAMHPFLAPAVIANLAKIDGHVLAALDKTTDALVLDR
jgi:hypothetical protein